jgi:hypothetical protein
VCGGGGGGGGVEGRGPAGIKVASDLEVLFLDGIILVYSNNPNIASA